MSELSEKCVYSQCWLVTTCLSNLKSVALTVLELLAYNAHFKLVRLIGPLRIHRQKHRHTSSRTHDLCHSLHSLGGDPYLTFGAGAQGTPALKPQFGPNSQPRQTSWSKKSLKGFYKPQEDCPAVDTVKSVQWERVFGVITEDRSLEQHCGTALSNEMNWSFLLILAREHTASFRRPIILRCRLRSARPVSNPTTILKSFFSRLKAKRARPLYGVFKVQFSLPTLRQRLPQSTLFLDNQRTYRTEDSRLEVLIPKDGPGPVKHEEEACLVSKSTLPFAFNWRR